MDRALRRVKIALVTGANRGIGLEVARQLAARDFMVFAGSRESDPHDDLIAELGENARVLHLDVADEASIWDAAAEAAKLVDRLDVLVNNAGILADEHDTILTVSPETVLRTLTTNTLGPLLTAQAFASLLAKSRVPRIINVSSGAGQLHDMENWAPAYSISKSALNAVTRQLAAELAPRGFAVNSVCPGWVRTDMGGAAATRSVAEGADTIVWLATEAPQTLTGRFLRDRQPIQW